MNEKTSSESHTSQFQSLRDAVKLKLAAQGRVAELEATLSGLKAACEAALDAARYYDEHEGAGDLVKRMEEAIKQAEAL